MSKQKSGFTIIETMLFLAISGLVFVGVVIGTNGSLRSQRYRDTVQGFVNSLRDVYSRAENTEIMSYGKGLTSCGYYNGDSSEAKNDTSRGRSNCAVYGIAAAIYTDEDKDEGMVYSSLLGGMDDAKVKENGEGKTGINLQNDYDYLYLAGVSEYFSGDDGSSWSRKGVTESKLLWGAKLRVLCSELGTSYLDYIPDCKSGDKTTDDIGVALIVYKSPNSGSLKTFARYSSGDRLDKSIESGANPKDDVERPTNFEDNILGELSIFKHRDVSFCIEAGEGMRSNGGMRMVTIDGDGTGENAIRLIEADSAENKCN